MQEGRPTLPGSDMPIMFNEGNGLNFQVPGMGGMNPTGSNMPMDFTSIASMSPAFGGDSVVNPSTGFDIGNVLPTTSAGSPSAGTVPLTGQQNPNPNSTINPNAGNSGVPGLTTGAGGFLGNTDITALTSQLDEIFGKGMGSAIINSISNQYNPQIAQSLIAGMQPALTQGRNNIRESFGASGGSGGSPLGLALSNFESQATLGENEILANTFQQAQNNSTGILSSLLRPAESFEANKSTVFDQISNVMKILSGLGLTGGDAGGSIGKLLQGLLGKLTGQQQKGSGGASGGSAGGPSSGGSNTGIPGIQSFPPSATNLINNQPSDIFTQWLNSMGMGNPNVPFENSGDIIGAFPGGSDPTLDGLLTNLFGNDVTPMPTLGSGNNSDSGNFDPFGPGGIDPGMLQWLSDNGFDPASTSGLGDMENFGGTGFSPADFTSDDSFVGNG